MALIPECPRTVEKLTVKINVHNMETGSVPSQVQRGREYAVIFYPTKG
jgi:hypothetical protein